MTRPTPRDWPENGDAYAILDVLPDATLIVDSEGTVRYANAMTSRLIGAPAEVLHGRPVADVLALRDGTGRDWWACARPLEADAHLLPRIPEQQLLLTTASGRSRPVVLTGARRAAGNGDAALVLSIRRAERRERVDRSRTDLVSTVSHELRSPLTSVKGFTKTLLAKWDHFSDAQKRQMLATVNEDADRVTRLLGELLDVSRIDAGRLQLRRQMIDARDVVVRVVARLNASDDSPGIDVEMDEDLPTLYADADKLAQVVTNLLENARNYGSGRIVVHAQVRDPEVVVTVSDAGGGIDAAHLPHLFAKFFRRPGERRPGTGLGLYISKGIVEAHGGRIWADSAPGRGTHFHLTLPRGGLELAGIDFDVLRRPARSSS